jgi:hypothetical protein
MVLAFFISKTINDRNMQVELHESDRVSFRSDVLSSSTVIHILDVFEYTYIVRISMRDKKGKPYEITTTVGKNLMELYDPKKQAFHDPLYLGE